MWKFVLFLACTVVVVYGCEDKKEASLAAPSAEPIKKVNTESQIKPESIITFPKGGFTCMDKDILQKVFLLGMQGAETKMSAYFIDQGHNDGNCISLSTQKQYKVISAEYNDEANPDWGLLEIVGANIKSAANGAWVIVLGADFVNVVKSQK